MPVWGGTHNSVKVTELYVLLIHRGHVQLVWKKRARPKEGDKCFKKTCGLVLKKNKKKGANTLRYGEMGCEGEAAAVELMRAGTVKKGTLKGRKQKSPLELLPECSADRIRERGRGILYYFHTRRWKLTLSSRFTGNRWAQVGKAARRDFWRRSAPGGGHSALKEGGSSTETISLSILCTSRERTSLSHD